MRVCTGGDNTVTPATGQKELVPQWFDVESAKGTQFTVTGYSVPVEGTATEGDQVCNLYCHYNYVQNPYMYIIQHFIF